MEVLVIGIKEMQINEEITDKEVRLISNDGEQLGIVSAAQAQKLAAEKNLDLVKIAPQAKPPVCKIMDYGKYRFEQSKREKEAKKNQRVIEIKEIRLSPNRESHYAWSGFCHDLPRPDKTRHTSNLLCSTCPSSPLHCASRASNSCSACSCSR